MAFCKTKTKILIKRNKKEKALKLLTNSYNRLSEKIFLEHLITLNFLKNNEKFEDAIKYYSEVLKNK